MSCQHEWREELPKINRSWVCTKCFCVAVFDPRVATREYFTAQTGISFGREKIWKQRIKGLSPKERKHLRTNRVYDEQGFSKALSLLSFAKREYERSSSKWLQPGLRSSGPCPDCMEIAKKLGMEFEGTSREEVAT